MKTPRFTTRWLMVVVACVGVFLAYRERWRRYERLAARHAHEAASIEMETNRKYPWLTWVLKFDEKARFHTRKSEEYKRAAPWPWIVVAVEEPPRQGYTPTFEPEAWQSLVEEARIKPNAP